MNYYPEKIFTEFLPFSAVSTPPRGVDVWLLDLSVIAIADTEKFLPIISQQEFERAQQFRKNQRHFIATRALLRQVLARYAGIAPEKLLFSRSLDGKPFLTNSLAPIYFNLTHSGRFAALAITAQGELGIDIETARKRSYLEIAERFFHADEVKQLNICEKVQEQKLFYRLWTLKEAFFKATGTGISTGLDNVCFYFNDNKITAHFSETLQLKESGWQFYQQYISVDTLVALAINSANPIKPQWFDGNRLLTES